MGCLVFVLILAMPRFVMVLVWLFSDYLSRAYDGFLIPLIGFFLLPTTTLAFAVARNSLGGPVGWEWVFVGIAVALDIGAWGRGRGAFSRND